MSIKQSELIWNNGKLVPWKDATVHVLSHALHYGTSVFEGIRVYDTSRGSRAFRLDDHIRRLFDSARMYRMELPYSQDDLIHACYELLEINQLSNAYIRPIVFYGYGSLGIVPSEDTPLQVTIAAFEWGAYLGEESLEKGVDVCVSSWNRLATNTTPTLAKAGGSYLNSLLISREAKRNGYHEAIALDTNGNLSEGPGENLFVVRDGVIYTPGMANSVLCGVTRDTVMKLATHLGYDVRESEMPREFLYMADELFFTGTAGRDRPDPLGRWHVDWRRKTRTDHQTTAAGLLRSVHRRNNRPVGLAANPRTFRSLLVDCPDKPAVYPGALRCQRSGISELTPET